MKKRILQFHTRRPFEPVGSTADIWDDFLAWWALRRPGRCLPCAWGPHNLSALTGLSTTQITGLLAKRTPTKNSKPVNNYTKLHQITPFCTASR